MAKNKNPADDLATAPAAPETDAAGSKDSSPKTAPPAGRIFIVRHQTMINGHVAGLVIRDHVCETEDAIKAHASQEFGCTVTDKATGKPAWPQSET